MSNKCISCGAEIPEGRQVCPNCEIESIAKAMCKYCQKMTETDCCGYELFGNGKKECFEGRLEEAEFIYKELKERR